MAQCVIDSGFLTRSRTPHSCNRYHQAKKIIQKIYTTTTTTIIIIISVLVYSFSNPTGRFCSSRSPTWIHLARAIFVHTHTHNLFVVCFNGTIIQKLKKENTTLVTQKRKGSRQVIGPLVLCIMSQSCVSVSFILLLLIFFSDGWPFHLSRGRTIKM